MSDWLSNAALGPSLLLVGFGCLATAMALLLLDVKPYGYELGWGIGFAGVLAAVGGTLYTLRPRTR